MKKKVIVGISGGVDSAIAALALKQSGYQVEGLHISNIQSDNNIKYLIRKISEYIDIPIKISQAEKEFNSIVIQHFRNQLLAGQSPSLCTYCNPNFKWRFLADYAMSRKAQHISTGHYIQLIKHKNTTCIKKGVDERKDQSYYLWNLSDEIIKKIITPLGNQTKEEVKKTAVENNLEFLLKNNESTGLCFSNNLSYIELIKKYVPESRNIIGGLVIDKHGKVIGNHNGYIYYTVGQKKGLTLDENLNYCVTKIDAKNNVLTAGEPRELWTKEIYIKDFNFRSLEMIINNSELEVKVRGFGWNPEGKANITILKDNRAKINLESPSWAPAAGQSAVIYYKNILLGGGVII